MRIYIAGPLNGGHCTEYLSNLHKFIEIDRQLRKLGFYTFNPALDFIVGIVDGTMTYDDYFDANLHWLEVCEAMFFIGHSPGADRELQRARELGLHVYTDIEEVPRA
jgi:hypothetical protein